MKSQNLVKYFVVAVLAVLCFTMGLSACKGKQAAVTWDVDSHVTVAVTGYDSLPDKVDKESKIVFTVTAKTGYVVKEVLQDGTALRAYGGKYTVTVNADTTIKVTTEVGISSVAVTSKPDKLLYNAGEQLDRTGMVVQVTYGDGKKETVDSYSVIYTGGMGSFALGENSFKVRYNRVDSAPVMLEEVISAKITIDPAGGVISEEYINALKANSEIKSVTAGDGGVLTLVLEQTLSEDILLPTPSQITKEDFTLLAWYIDELNVTTISKDTMRSTDLKAGFMPDLVQLDSVYMDKSEDGENYLVITGIFGTAAKEVYLYLYEGNKDIRLEGDHYTGNAGDSFVCKFNMRKLAEKEDFLGAWMDIRFKAGEKEMEIETSLYPDNFVDLDQMLFDDTYNYTFKTWGPEGTNFKYLKLCAEKGTPVYDYTIEVSTDNNGNPTVTFKGTVFDKKYVGKTVRIDWWISGTVDGFSVIGEDGSWSITFTLTSENGFELNTDGYAHLRIVESAENFENDGILWAYDNDSNLLNTNRYGQLSYNYKGIGLITGGAVRLVSADGTVEYFVGAGTWGGIVFYARQIG